VPAAVRVDESIDQVRVLDAVLAERQSGAPGPRARYGAFDIDSIPPATMQRASPARICEDASITL